MKFFAKIVNKWKLLTIFAKSSILGFGLCSDYASEYILSYFCFVMLMCIKFNYLSAIPNKMVKHTQAICRQKPTNCLSVFDHFMGLALKGLKWWFCINCYCLNKQSIKKCFAVRNGIGLLRDKTYFVTYILFVWFRT